VITEYLIGTFVGIVIGVISGVVALVLLRTMNRMSTKDVAALVAVVAEFLAIPTFMFMGQYLASHLIKWIEPEVFSLPYLVTVSVVFAIIVGPAVFKWVHRISFELGQEVSQSDD
jgi:hypothetical protein